MRIARLGEFLSFQTLFTAFLGVAIWSLFRDWQTGLLLTLLLYLHEIGHILAALLRRLPIRQGPTFIPGLGAFVLVEENESPVDALFLNLGGPVIGALGALLLFWVGVWAGDWHLLWAGRMGLWLNLVNLLPLMPFDGGRVIRWTGRIGLIAGLIAAVLISIFSRLSGILVGIGLTASWRAIKEAKHALPIPLRTRLTVLGVYLLTGGLIYGLLWLIPEMPQPPRESIPALVPLQWAAVAFCALYLLSYLLRGLPWEIDKPAWLRHGAHLLLGWPRLLLRPWRLRLVLQIVSATLSGRWDRPSAALLARLQQGEGGAGEAAAWLFDARLLTQGPATATAWWEQEIRPALLQAGALLVAEAHAGLLIRFGHPEVASSLLQAVITAGWAPESIDVGLAHAIAEYLRREGLVAEALPYARRSIKTDDADARVQFAHLCLENGDLTAAEEAFALALDLKRSPTVLLGLGEVYARQGRLAEALSLGTEAYEKRITDYWDQDEPTEEEINATRQRWQEERHPPGEE